LLWEDAVAKLPPRPVPGGWRTLFSLSREYLIAGQLEPALVVAERCIAEYPRSAHCYIVRGVGHLESGNPGKGAEDLGRALELKPGDPFIQMQLAQAVKRRDAAPRRAQ
jgi:hypothetical protein